MSAESGSPWTARDRMASKVRPSSSSLTEGVPSYAASSLATRSRTLASPITLSLFPSPEPARLASQLAGFGNPSIGFFLLNATLIAFGLWCYLARVRRGAASSARWVWPWVLLELGNGLVHLTMAILRGGYFPGVATAPVLFAIASYLASQLLRGASTRHAAT